MRERMAADTTTRVQWHEDMMFYLDTPPAADNIFHWLQGPLYQFFKVVNTPDVNQLLNSKGLYFKKFWFPFMREAQFKGWHRESLEMILFHHWQNSTSKLEKNNATFEAEYLFNTAFPDSKFGGQLQCFRNLALRGHWWLDSTVLFTGLFA